MLAFVLSLASAATPQVVPQQYKQVNATTFVAWRDHIRPLAKELRWQEIDWHDSISTGIEAAKKHQRPMLLWLMNGHPLGCT